MVLVFPSGLIILYCCGLWRESRADTMAEVNQEVESQAEGTADVKQDESSSEDSVYILIVGGSSPMKCDMCGKVYRSHVNLVNHIRIHHLRPAAAPGSRDCVHCPASVPAVRYMAHLRLHRIHACQHCGKKYATRPSLIRHQRNEHVQHRNRFYCAICEHSWLTRDGLKKHVKRVHLEMEMKTVKDHHCPECDKAFATNAYVIKHLGLVHPRVLLQCDHCEEQFKRKDHMERHLQTMHGGGKLSFWCNMCSRRFSCSAYLRKHKYNVHRVERTCRLCGKRFPSKCKLNHHLMRRHCKRLFECDVCGKHLQSKYSLVLHIKNYHPERYL